MKPQSTYVQEVLTLLLHVAWLFRPDRITKKTEGSQRSQRPLGRARVAA